MYKKLIILSVILACSAMGYTQTINILSGGSFTQCAGNMTDSDVAAGIDLARALGTRRVEKAVLLAFKRGFISGEPKHLRKLWLSVLSLVVVALDPVLHVVLHCYSYHWYPV